MKKAVSIILAALTVICCVVPAWADDVRTEAIPIEPEKKITFENNCDIELYYSEILSDQSVAEGWWYYYTDTLDNPAVPLEWKPHNGMHSTVIALFNVTNLRNEPVVLKDILNGHIEFGDLTFEGTVFQRNPEQVDTDGFEIRSLKGVSVNPGETVCIDVLFDVSKEFHNTACAGFTDVPATAFFSLDSGEILSFSLNEFMEISE
ncbi:MAG: hypothetical protein Q4F31_05100 [Eubacteriales bacterium]|nr:hypothetical protein [Eubacteriales bacterium]